MCSTDIFLGLLAVLFPPLPVWVKRGICSADSIINILLLILGYIPGLLHAWYIIAKYPDPPSEYDYQGLPQDAEHGRIYVFVHDGGHHSQAQGYQQQQQGRQQPKQQAHMNYGTANSNNNTAGGAGRNQQQHPPQEQGTMTNGGGAEAGPSDGGAPPPSYAQVVAGDHKVQSQE